MMYSLAPNHDIAHLHALLGHVKQFRTAVDGGAHVGFWARELAKRFTRVVAIEPYAPHVQQLREMDGVEVHHAALGARAGRAGIAGGPHNDGQWHVTEGDEVQVIALDVLHLKDVDLLKLDVEGYELFALRGAEHTIERCRPVIMVEENGLCERYGVAWHEAAEWLTGIGYRRVERLNKDEVYVPKIGPE